MKYVALIRGINVGGNNVIKMTDLKEAFEKAGFTDVATYIQSGNVIFFSEEKSTTKIAQKLESNLSKVFKLDLRVVVQSSTDIVDIVARAPDTWKNGDDLRCYVAFVRAPITPTDILCEVTLNEGIDSAKTGPGVLYMSTKLEGITKSGFTKLAGKKIYKDITIRNYNTVLKLLSLMQNG